MKQSFLVAIVSLSIAFSTLASADNSNPNIIPGGSVQLNSQEISALDAIFKQTELFQELSRYGKTVLGVKLDQRTEMSIITVYIGSCTFDPVYFCTAKAALLITRGYQPGRGIFTNALVVTDDLQYTPGFQSVVPVAIVEALLRSPKGLRDLRMTGNAVKSAAMQFISPTFSRYAINVGQCGSQLGRVVCMGGATLSIEKMTTFNGIISESYYKSKIINRLR